MEGWTYKSFINNVYTFYQYNFYIEPMIREKLMSGKLLIEWRHEICKEIAQKRYRVDQEKARLAHAEVVNLFFPQESEDSDEAHSEISEKSSESIPKSYFLFF